MAGSEAKGASVTTMITYETTDDRRESDKDKIARLESEVALFKMVAEQLMTEMRRMLNHVGAIVNN